MALSEARRIAFEMLLRVETEGAYAADALHARLEAAGGRLKREDAALATELTFGSLRWQRLLDFLLAVKLVNRVDTLDPAVRIALRMGAFQLRFLSRIPPRAAIYESVELVKHTSARSGAGLVNAVLRQANLALPDESLAALIPRGLSAAERLGILYSHPTWLVERWLAALSEARVVELMKKNNQPAPMTCALHPNRDADEHQILNELARAGLRTQAGTWLRHAAHIRGGSPAATKAWRRGWISIQDEASQMIPLLLDVRPGNAVLDLCAAPGGKTRALEESARPRGMVVAADLHLNRLRAMVERLAKAGMPSSRAVALDATQPLPFARQFDRILVDASCSGTGTLARNPEARWRLRPGDIAQLSARQQCMLEQAVHWLAPGGRLVYSTCSLEPEENEAVVESVLARHADLRLVDGAPALAPHLREGADISALFDSRRFFRTMPVEHGTDGFFAAVLEKVPAQMRNAPASEIR